MHKIKSTCQFSGWVCFFLQFKVLLKIHALLFWTNYNIVEDKIQTNWHALSLRQYKVYYGNLTMLCIKILPWVSMVISLFIIITPGLTVISIVVVVVLSVIVVGRCTTVVVLIIVTWRSTTQRQHFTMHSFLHKLKWI